MGKGGTPLSVALRLPNIAVTRVENFCASGSEAFRGAVYAVAAGDFVKSALFSRTIRWMRLDSDGCRHARDAPRAFSETNARRGSEGSTAPTITPPESPERQHVHAPLSPALRRPAEQRFWEHMEQRVCRCQHRARR